MKNNKKISLIDKFSTACLMMAYVETKTREILKVKIQDNPNLHDGSEPTPQTSADRIVKLATTHSMADDGFIKKNKPTKPTLNEMYKMALQMVVQASKTIGVGSYSNAKEVESEIYEVLNDHRLSNSAKVKI